MYIVLCTLYIVQCTVSIVVDVFTGPSSESDLAISFTHAEIPSHSLIRKDMVLKCLGSAASAHFQLIHVTYIENVELRNQEQKQTFTISKSADQMSD